MIDYPDDVSEIMMVPLNQPFVFEDRAQFIFLKKNFSSETVRTTVAEGYHKTTFTNNDTGVKCTIDGSLDKNYCKIEKTRFEIYFAGSAGVVAADVQCLRHDSENTIAIDNENKFTFNNMLYNSEEYIGLGIGTFTIIDIPNSHPFAIGNEETSWFEFVSCSGTTFKGSTANNELVSSNFAELDFCSGNYTFKILSDFNIASTVCYYHGYMGGQHRLMFDDSCVNHEVTTTSDDDDDGLNMLMIAVIFAVVFIAIAGMVTYHREKLFGTSGYSELVQENNV